MELMGIYLFPLPFFVVNSGDGDGEKYIKGQEGTEG